MSNQLKSIPDGFHSLTPMLTVNDGEKAIDFYKDAFGAVELLRMTVPHGKAIMHAELKIGNSIFFIGEEMGDKSVKSPQTLRGTTVSFYVYVQNVDDAFKQAVAAGAKVEMPLIDMFWGDRCGTVQDPFGHQWMLATHVKDVTPEEMEKAKESFGKP